MKKLYKYSELKGKIKVGDIVSAEPGKDNVCGHLKNDGSNTQKITEVGENYFRINGYWYGFTNSSYLNLHDESHRQPTWEDLRVGDVLVDVNGCDREIYEITGKIIWIYSPNSKTIASYTNREELKDKAFKIKQLEDPEKTIEIDGKKLTLTQLKEAVKKLED